MNKAFLFDLDGVLIDDEQIWEDKKQALYEDFFGSDVTSKLGSTLGVNLDAIYERAAASGVKVSKTVFTDAIYGIADEVYAKAPIPEGLDELVAALKKLDFRIGIVSASPMSWITTVLNRLSFKNDFELVISLTERDDLAHKPAPDGYIEAMKALGSEPAVTFILEDSNSGIQAAKASGAYTIGLRQNLAKGYVQTGADEYAHTARDVIDIVQKRTRAN